MNVLTSISPTLKFKTPYPLSVVTSKIEIWKWGYTVRLSDLNLYGAGDTEHDAVEMLKREIASLYNELKGASMEELGPEPQKWKTFLTNNIEEVLKIAGDVPVMTEEEQLEMRRYLALSHEEGKCHIYGDDGELQCSNIARHGRSLDFKREKISDLLSAIESTKTREYYALRGKGQ